jgi:hypothetical protein
MTPTLSRMAVMKRLDKSGDQLDGLVRQRKLRLDTKNPLRFTAGSVKRYEQVWGAGTNVPLPTVRQNVGHGVVQWESIYQETLQETTA